MNASALALSAALLATLASAPADARAELCGDRVKIIERLGAKHSESLVAEGLASDGGVLEVLASPDGGFTVLMTYPKRPTCIIAVGKAWQLLKIRAGAPV